LHDLQSRDFSETLILFGVAENVLFDKVLDLIILFATFYVYKCKRGKTQTISFLFVYLVVVCLFVFQNYELRLLSQHVQSVGVFDLTRIVLSVKQGTFPIYAQSKDTCTVSQQTI